jgi:carotenoid cleavage dioxygenase-like enzyme
MRHARSFSRRHLLELAGFGGLSLLGGRLLSGCADPESINPVRGVPSPEPPDDPSQAWWLRGNYAPVEESEAARLEVVGAVPPALAGMYLRNGPNPTAGGSAHWFLGDGMAHGIRLENGAAAWYRSRLVQTTVLGRIADDTPGPPGLAEHQANTSILGHGGRVLCLQEIGLPYEIDVNDLSTLGTFDFGGLLQGPMTAHPKVDPATGDLLFFGYGLLDSSVTLHRADPTGKLVQSEKIPLPKPVMMHDFQITDTHVIFMDLPIVFDLDLAISGESLPFRWDPTNGARLGAMPRAGTAADIEWFEIEPCFVFHTWNAFHDPADRRRILLDGVRYPEMWTSGPSDFEDDGLPTRFALTLGTGKASVEAFDDRQTEFPRIHKGRQGQVYRYGYGVSATTAVPGLVLPPLDQIVKLDLSSGSRVDYALPAGQVADEPTFVPDPAGTSEDDGWLLSYVFDDAVNRSHLLILDASAMKEVGKVLLPVRVPHGFHGDFLPDEG